MSIRAILLPVCVEVALTFMVLFYHGRTLQGDVNTTARGEPQWRTEVSLATLFYVLAIFAWHTQFADLLFILLAWVFVTLRVLDAIPRGAMNFRWERHGLFIASAIVLLLMWGIYAVRIFLVLG